MKIKQAIKNLFTVNAFLKITMLVLAFFLAVAMGATARGSSQDDHEADETVAVSIYHS